jgi:hypothetical protein
MARYRYDARLYEDRYRRVYEAGAAFWEESIPTEALVKFLSESKLSRGLNAIDMGCGEGRDSILLAKIQRTIFGRVSKSWFQCCEDHSGRCKASRRLLGGLCRKSLKIIRGS